MTREEAIALIENKIKYTDEICHIYGEFINIDDYEKLKEALKLAIEALQEPETITLTYDEQCIFLAAMRRERWICQDMDEYEDSETKVKPLVPIVDEIERKVKAVLWSENNG